MNCLYCGKELSDNARVCYGCGKTVKRRGKLNVFSVAGVALAVSGAVLECIYTEFSWVSYLLYGFLICLAAGFVLSIIGTVKSKGQRLSKALGIIGIAVSSVALLIAIAFFVVILILFTNIGNF